MRAARPGAVLACAVLAVGLAEPLPLRAQDAGPRADRERLLELHDEQRRAHLDKDASLLVSQFADEVLTIEAGEVSSATREESRRRLQAYLDAVRFLEWEDAAPPVVRVSDDGTLAHVIVQKRVRLVPSRSEGDGAEEATRFAWLATYEKRDGEWRLTAVASTDRPEHAAADVAPAVAETLSDDCGDDPERARLDFWLGEWDVQAGGRTVGSNRIEKVLGGCAVVEHWTDARGGRGMSLFYVPPGGGPLRQVWVTERAPVAGGTKEKRRVDAEAPGAVRFQGEIPLAAGGSYLDRTTLTPLDGGRVRQVIEVSRSGGDAWQTVFDAVYVRKATAGN